MFYLCVIVAFILKCITTEAFIDCPVTADNVDLSKDFHMIVKKLILVDKNQTILDDDVEVKKVVILVFKPKEEFVYRSLELTATDASKLILQISSTEVIKKRLGFSPGISSVEYKILGDGVQNLKAIKLKIVGRKKHKTFIINSMKLTGCFEQKMCPELPQLENGITVMKSRKPGGKTHFYCGSAYELIGGKITTCLSTGEWNSLVPFCRYLVHCTRPKHPKNGLVFVNRHHQGESAFYRCNPGYTLHGARERYCQSNGEWDTKAPSCEPNA